MEEYNGRELEIHVFLIYDNIDSKISNLISKFQSSPAVSPLNYIFLLKSDTWEKIPEVLLIRLKHITMKKMEGQECFLRPPSFSFGQVMTPGRFVPTPG